MRTRAIARPASRQGITVRTTAAALVLLAVILAAASGVARVDVSGEPPALTAPGTAR